MSQHIVYNCNDSHCVFHTLARRVLSLNLALSGRFVRLANFCFKTTARIKIFTGNIICCALVPAGSNLYFLFQRDLEGAQDMFFKECEILSKINETSSKLSVYDLLKHQNIQNQPRIISKTDTPDVSQFDLLPRALH